MSKLLKSILAKSGKKTTVSYDGKDNRKAFDESFAKKKVELISSVVGSDENARTLSKKLN